MSHVLTIQLHLRRLRLILPLCVGLLVLFAPQVAAAHPLGNFTVNRYSRVEINAQTIDIVYIIDMAEIPTFQAMPQIDSNGDGTVDDTEKQQYLAHQVPLLQSNLHLSVGGTSLVLTPHDPQLSFPDGQGGLKTLRLNVHFAATPPAGSSEQDAEYRDGNYVERIGWKEIVVRASPGATLVTSSASATDVSQELRQYPQDMLQSPLDVTTATFRFAAVADGRTQSSGTSAGSTAPVVVRGTQADQQFAALIAIPVLGPGALALALLAAFGLGAAHALAPGHGKTIVAAYLVGSRGTARHAVFLGLTTTVTHTAGVFALGLITLFVSKFILPEQLYPWLGVASGLLVFGIGLTLLRGRLRALTQKPTADHDLRYGFDHEHGPDTHTHDHDFAIADWAADQDRKSARKAQNTVSWRNLLALGVSGGLLPCPSALVVLLSAIALGRVGFGLLLIVAFSIGLAAVLTTIGILLVHAGRLFERFPTRHRALRILPAISAFVVLIAGAGITLQALNQMGLISI